MKKSKRISAFIAAVLMIVTVFSGGMTVSAADYPEPTQKLAPREEGAYIVTGYRSKISTTEMSAKTVTNLTATIVAATIVVNTVDSKGNLVKATGKPDQSNENSKTSPVAYVKSGSGNKFTYVYIVYAGLFNNNKTVSYSYNPIK